eukprot:3661937-Alexandrium_andersonii.AAC.1
MARAGCQFTYFVDQPFLQQVAVRGFAADSREAWQMAAVVHGKWIKEGGRREAWRRAAANLARAFVD